MRKTVPFMIDLKKFRNKLNKGRKDFCNKIYKILKKEIEKDSGK
jgi:hypothetical protein